MPPKIVLDAPTDRDPVVDDPLRQQAQSRVGSIFGEKFLLRSVLGVGGMGAVFGAEHRFTGAKVALKLLHPQFAGHTNTVRRFLDEARAAEAIGHPGVVRVQDAGQDPGTMEVYIAMELLRGESLGAAIEHRSVDLRGLLQVTIDLLDILRASHAAGVIHRDVKPENVFVTRAADGSRGVKLLDFGIARFVAEGGAHTRTGALLGTPWYMSPEQVHGLHVDARSDLWSVGAMLYHILADRPPFEGATQAAIFVSILQGVTTPIAKLCPKLPRAVAAAIDRALVVDVSRRWQSAAQMREAFEEALMSMPSEVVPINSTFRKHVTRMGWSARPERPRRVDTLVGAVAAVTVVVIALAVVVYQRRHGAVDTSAMTSTSNPPWGPMQATTPRAPLPAVHEPSASPDASTVRPGQADTPVVQRPSRVMTSRMVRPTANRAPTARTPASPTTGLPLDPRASTTTPTLQAPTERPSRTEPRGWQ